jgi:superfamily II DNA or RNA helicase
MNDILRKIEFELSHQSTVGFGSPLLNTTYFELKIDGERPSLVCIEELPDRIGALRGNFENAVCRDREFITAYEAFCRAKRRADDSLGWSESSSDVRTFAYPLLTEQLARLGRLRLGGGARVLSIEQDSASIICEITECANFTFDMVCKCRTGTTVVDSYKILSPSLVLVGEKIYPLTTAVIFDIDVMSFKMRLTMAELTRAMCVVLGCVPEVEVVMPSWTFIRERAPIPIEPTLIVDEVTEELATIVRIAAHPPESPQMVSGNRTKKGDTDSFLVSSRAGVRIELNLDLRAISVRPSSVNQERLLSEQFIKFCDRISRRKKLSRAVMADEGSIVLPIELAVTLFTEEFGELLSSYRIYNSNQLERFNIKSVVPRFNIGFQSKMRYLDNSEIPAEAEIVLDGKPVAIQELLRGLHPSGYVEIGSNNRILLPPKFIKALKMLIGGADGSEDKQRKSFQLSISQFDVPILEDLVDEFPDNEWFHKNREFLVNLPRVGHVDNPRFTDDALPPIKVTLRPYQEYGVEWLRYLEKYGRGGILADDMGLGKTLQAITVLAMAHQRSSQTTDLRKKSRTKSADLSLTSLIIVPKSLLYNWSAEIARFTPWLSVYTYHGANRILEDARTHDIILTTYGTLRSDFEKFSECEFFYIVLDEAQAVKNIHSQTAQSVFDLRARHRLALTGTPIENSLAELYSLFSFLNPGMFRSFAVFERNYLKPIQQERDSEVAAILRRRISPYILRRMKADVLKELPDKIEQTITIELEDSHKALYAESVRHFSEQIKRQIDEQGVERSRMHVFQALLQLRQIASCPAARIESATAGSKLPVLVELLREAVEGGHKCLVFTHFLQSIEEIADEFSRQGIGYLTITGSTNDRGKVVREFEQGNASSALIMTIKTGGVGLNLVSADTVFIYEPWWNLAAEQQAIDRCHRIGQRKTVTSYRLITKGTIEEKMSQLQQLKKGIFDQVLASDGVLPKVFTSEDIDFLLSFDKDRV